MRKIFAVSLAVLFVPCAAHADTKCTTGLSGGTVAGTLVVPNGAFCVAENETVTGNLQIDQGATLSGGNLVVLGNVSVGASASLEINGTNAIHGNLDAERCAIVLIYNGSSMISGNVDIRGCTPPHGGDVAEISFASIGGNVICRDNSGSCNFDYNSISNSVRISNNTGGTIVLYGNLIDGKVVINGNSSAAVEFGNNTISGNLNCSGNVPPPTNGGQQNTVDGTESGQCAGPNF